MDLKVPLLAAAIAALAMPAMADCRAEIAKLDQQLTKVDADLQRKSSDSAKKKKELALPAQPKESWNGSPHSTKNAKEQIENAKSMATDGKEDGCMKIVQEARQMMEDPVKAGDSQTYKPDRKRVVLGKSVTVRVD